MKQLMVDGIKEISKQTDMIIEVQEDAMKTAIKALYGLSKMDDIEKSMEVRSLPQEPVYRLALTEKEKDLRKAIWELSNECLDLLKESDTDNQEETKP